MCPDQQSLMPVTHTELPTSQEKIHLEQTGSKALSPGREPTGQDSTAQSTDTGQPAEQLSLPTPTVKHTSLLYKIQGWLKG